ncbi:MAG: hypothetical protein ACRDZ4_10470 [Egibacteraceae bacterium]
MSTLDYAGLLNSTHYPSRGAGTFLRAYPDTDEPTELNGTLARLLGSTIFFDHRPYRPGSLARYRYVAFAWRIALGNGGEYKSMLQGLAGTRNDGSVASLLNVSTGSKDRLGCGRRSGLLLVSADAHGGERVGKGSHCGLGLVLFPEMLHLADQAAHPRTLDFFQASRPSCQACPDRWARPTAQ